MSQLNRETHTDIEMHRRQAGVDLDAKPPKFPRKLSPGLIQYALGVMVNIYAITPDAINSLKREELRTWLRGLDRMGTELMLSAAQEHRGEWDITVLALIEKIEASEKQILKFFENNKIPQEEQLADTLDEEFAEIQHLQNQFHQDLQLKSNTVVGRAQIQKQYENLKNRIKEFDLKLLSQESKINPNRLQTLRSGLYKLNESFTVDRRVWREQQFSRLTRIQDKAKLFFSDIGTGLSQNWSLLTDSIKGKDEKSLAKKLKMLESDVNTTFLYIELVGQSITPVQRDVLHDELQRLKQQALNLQNSFLLLQERRSFTRQSSDNTYEQRIKNVGVKLASYEFQEAMNDLKQSTDRETAVRAIEKGLGSLNFIAENSRGENMEQLIQLQNEFEGESQVAMQKFNIKLRSETSPTNMSGIAPSPETGPK